MNLMQKLCAASALIASAAAPAVADPFTLLIFEGPAQLALREAKTPDGAAYWEAWGAAGKAMTDAGIVRGGSALTIGPAVGITGAAGRTSPIDAAAPLALGGYFQIDVADAEAALEWAAKLPVADGLVEVRAGYPVPQGM